MVSDKKVLNVEDLRVCFDTYRGEVQAVRGVSFDVCEGEALAIVGESGCGKSVTAHAVTRLLPEPPARITGGRINLDGTDVVNAGKKTLQGMRGSAVGMIFQDPMTSLNPTMTVGKQLREALLRHNPGMGLKDAELKAAELLSEVRIPNAAQRFSQYPSQFSGGMRQRVMIAIAIACKPKLLIADEPTTALDVTTQAQILDLLKSIQSANRMAIILITHDLSVASCLVDRVAVMYAGQIVEKGLAKQIFQTAAHPYTWGLMDSLPRPDQDKSRDLNTIAGSPPSLLSPPAECSFAPRCHFCMQVCSQRQPPGFELGPGHTCSCWLHHPMAADMLKQAKEASGHV